MSSSFSSTCSSTAACSRRTPVGGRAKGRAASRNTHAASGEDVAAGFRGNVDVRRRPT
jgi:hypothetical protein